MRHLKTYIGPICAFLAICGAMTLIASSHYNWGAWRPASCLPHGCFNEAIRSDSIAQPSNTWSSLGFVLIGLLILGKGRADTALSQQECFTNSMRSSWMYPAVFGVALIVIGLGSAFYHASLTFVGQVLDVQGMYLLITFALLYNLSRLDILGGRAFVATYLFLNGLLLFLQVQLPGMRRYAFAALIVATLGVEYQLRQRGHWRNDLRFIQAAVVLLAVAFLIWILDIKKIFFNPYSLIQGHAIWHLLSALSGGCLYLYYRSDASRNAGADKRFKSEI